MDSAKPSAAVIIAAILAMLGSLFMMLCLGLGLMGLYLAPGGMDVTGAPPFAFAAVATGMVFTFAVCVLGVFTGIGLLRLRNWARISALIWAGFTVLFCSLVLIGLLVLPFPPLPATGQSINIGTVKLMIAVIYGLPILIGAWWLALFNQKETKSLFKGSTVLTSPEVAVKPRCPLPVAIVAGLMLFSVTGMFMAPLMHLPISVILFGQRQHGELGAFLYAASTVLYLAAAIGLLRLKRWSYPLAVGQYVFWMVSGAVTLLRGNYVQNMQEVLADMHITEAQGNITQIVSNRFFMLFSLIPGLLLLVILLYYRSRFLQAAAAAESSRS